MITLDCSEALNPIITMLQVILKKLFNQVEKMIANYFVNKNIVLRYISSV